MDIAALAGDKLRRWRPCEQTNGAPLRLCATLKAMSQSDPTLVLPMFRFPESRATRWRLRTRTLQFASLPCIMGIVNVTPDSFSDGGRFLDPGAAIEQAMQLEAQGADILDIGGESTRPYAEPVDSKEELRRVLPVVEAVCRQARVPVSVDTSKALVARAALEAGAEIINDVTALTGDTQMTAVVAEHGAAVCAMHMKGTPQTMQDSPRYDDVVREVFDYLADRRTALEQAGIDRDRICLDPGIGFGKTNTHNLALLAHCWRLHQLGCPILVGHSRKGFIAKIVGDPQADRTPGTIGVACALAAQGVQVIRVHDVAAVRQALMLYLTCQPAADER
jgi:dihydropteroate synthase